ncbi:non-ribosomal peptide synthetase [Streptomyces cinnamoneus]|nr:non-ribosomal peptide synthetase [Streptomyces cinnamoneus]
MTPGLRYRMAEPTARDAGGCHSLTLRLDAGATFETVRARARAAAGAVPAAAGLSVWYDRLTVAHDDPAALARVRAEAGRPLGGHGTARSLRAVFLGYADGRADLVLVARRAEVPRKALRGLGALLSRGTPLPPAPVVSADAGGGAAAAGPEGAHAAPEWGLGDPSAADWFGDVAVPWAEAAPDALLLAATAVTAARHAGSDEPAVALWPAAPAADGMRVRAVALDEQQTAGDLVARCRALLDGSPAGDDARRVPVPQVGCVFDDDRPGERYRPFLAPALPLVVHWLRAADGSVTGTLGYRAGEVDPCVARDFAAHLAHVAGQLLATPSLRLGETELIGEAEAARLLADGATAPTGSPDADRTLHGLLSDVARRRPDAIAVADEKTELTYAELERRSELVARGLRALGAEPGGLIAVALDRTAEFVVALVGIVKAGFAYVPLDVRYPEERLRYTLEDAGAPVVIGRPETLPRFDGVRLVPPEELYGLGESAPAAPPPVTDTDQPAYVIYTSGSTGRPKGVVVPHRNVTALIAATRDRFGLGAGDTWTFFHSGAFDFSVWEIWGCLLTGGRLVVVPYWATRDTELFYELVDRWQVTVLSQTPSAFAQFIETDARLRARVAVRLVVLGGEALDVGVLGTWFARHSATECRVANMFGITETTVHVTEQSLTPADVVAGSRAVGKALPGWSLSVRDPRGRVLPAGVAGEIHVGGAGVARGYLRRPELTAERFVTDPYSGERLYRSGDLGRLRPDGRLDHLGRIDNQVKVRGHRIELDEIRGVLLGHPSVAGAAVVLRNGVARDRDTARIDAYFVARGGSGLRRQDLLDHAATMLPDYMMPATLTEVGAIPLTANGKADLAALPEPEAAAAPPRAAGSRPGPAAEDDPTAATVLALWSRMLNTEVGPHDNFFELGGNSLLVIRLLRELRDHGLPRVSVRDFYRNSVAVQFIGLLRDSGS